MMSFSINAYLTENRKNILCLVISIIGFSLDWYTFYPGFMSPDSLDQYAQSVKMDYTDWHPPIMSLVWTLFGKIVSGPQPMLLMQLLILWTSFFILSRVFIKNYSALFFLVILFFFAPYIQNFAGNIWKDVHMSLSWLFAITIMINAFYDKRKMRWWEASISFLAICYGCWLRVNALPGGVPLLAFWIATTFPSSIKGVKQIIIFALKTIGLTVVVLIIQFSITELIIKPWKNHIEFKLFVQDLSGIYLKTGEMCFPDFIKNRPEFDTAYLRKNYKYHTFDQFWWNADNKLIFPLVQNEENIKDTRQLWLRTLKKYPLVYLEIKSKGFLDFLRITDSGTRMCTFFPYIHPNDFGLSYTPNRMGDYFFKWMYKVEHAIYMKPWFWVLLNFILLGLSFISKLKKIKPPLLALSLSSLFYLAFEFFVFPADTEFRYFYWNCMAVSVGLMMVIAELIYTSTNLGNRTKTT